MQKKQQQQEIIACTQGKKYGQWKLTLSGIRR